MHRIRVDRDAALVDVTLSGFFHPLAAMRATDDVRHAVRSLGDAAGRHVTLYDMTDADIAPGPTVEAIKGAYADPAIRHLWARKVAYVAPSALARMQLKRLREVRPDIGIFADRKAALAFLTAD